MRVLIATDAFPPICGGSGWSTFELARGLRDRGHDVTIVRPRINHPDTGEPEYEGFRPIAFRAEAPRVPFVRNYFKNERLYKAFATFLSALVRREKIDLLHAQHVLTVPPGIAAARATGIPSVCTIRDYWPVCYWSDLILDRSSDQLCPACTPGNMTRCLRPHAGAAWPLGLPAIPYMRSNLAMKRRSLAAADAVIAVSGVIARDLRERAPELSRTRLEVIPNPVNIAAIRAAAARAPRQLDGPYAIYVGKLEPNKGASKLMPALDRARLEWPMVVVGDGVERRAMEAAARASGRDARFTGWLERHEALAWLGHASMLVFPSHGPESLSRVLLEASALGIPIAAMDTGGTRDIVIHEETGLLSQSAQGLGDHVARLRADEPLRDRLGRAARERTERVFDAGSVIDRVESLYRDLAGTSRAA